MKSFQRGWRDLIPDTPCARCGHPHNEISCSFDNEWPPSTCGKVGWLLAEDGGSMSWATCSCPEWVQPELCFCGRPTSSLPMTTYLNGIRACSVACALEGQRRQESAA